MKVVIVCFNILSQHYGGTQKDAFKTSNRMAEIQVECSVQNLICVNHE